MLVWVPLWQLHGPSLGWSPLRGGTDACRFSEMAAVFVDVFIVVAVVFVVAASAAAVA